jgi:hypothetical protein
VLLVRPPDGARVTKPPTFVWRGQAKATFYNFQLYWGTWKVLSAWPTNPQLPLARRWRFGGFRHWLRPGRYHWYVWPALGSRAHPSYGSMLGQSSFVVPARSKRS